MTVDTAVAVIAALGAAAMFGVSSVLMFLGTPSTDDHPSRSGVRRSHLWRAGAALQVLSFLVQAVGLAFGPLALVQPVAATDLLFALPVLAAIQGRRLRRHEWLAAFTVAGGVAVFLGVSPPRAGDATAHPREWVVAVLAVTLVSIAGLAGARFTTRVARTVLLAIAGSATFGLVDALSKNFVGQLRVEGVTATLLSWEPYALAVAGVVGLALSQLTFRSGSLHISLPVIDTLEPTSAVLIGTVVFHEALASTTARLLVQLAGAALAVVGMVMLDRAWRLAGASTAAPTCSGLSPLPPRDVSRQA